jgi:hypothetical protein
MRFRHDPFLDPLLQRRDVLPGLDIGPAPRPRRFNSGGLICHPDIPGRIVPVKPRGPG